MTTYNSLIFSLDESLRRLTEYYERPGFVCCEYADWLERITYKPLWRMAVICEAGSAWVRCDQGVQWPLGRNEHRLIVVARVTDAYHPQRETQVAFNHFVPGGLGREEFVRFIRQLLLDCERHEFDEFFRVDGIQFHNPH